MRKHPRGAQKSGLFAQLKTGIGLNWGRGGITNTRASSTLTVDSNGYYQSVATDVPAFDANGLRVTPQLANKCQCYGLIPDDEEQAALTSGTMTVGRVYKIKVQSSNTDFVADGAPNPHAVGDTFVCTAATVTLTAAKSVAEMKWAVGTKVFSGGTAIPGVFVGADSGSNYIEIVNNYGGVSAGILTYLNTNGKVLKFVRGGGTYLYLRPAGATGNTNAHSVSAVVASGTQPLQVKLQGVSGTASGAVWAHVTTNNKTPSSSAILAELSLGANGYAFACPLVGLYESTVAPLYPVRANSTSASTVQAQTIASLPLAPNFRQSSFMVTEHVTPDFALANIPNSTNVAIATLTSGTANNLLYFAKDGSGNGSLNCYDGTNTATIAWTPVAGTTYKIGCRGNTALNELQVSLNGTNGTATSYGGGIAVDGQNKIYLQGINGGLSHKNVKTSPDRGAAALAAATT